MSKYLIALFVSMLCSVSFGQNISYTLEMKKPQNHYYNVTMDLEGFKEKELSVKMPIWAPGSYLAREFAKNVNLVTAFDESGNELPVKKTNKNTWCIKKGKAKKVKVHYDVYAFELTVRTSFLDLTHGFVSGTGVFMYVAGHKDDNGEVKVIPYEGFSVVTTALKEKADGVTGDGAKTFTFNNYDQLVDCPIEIGNQEEFSFDAAGVKHHVAIYGQGNYDIASLKKDMAKVVESSTNVFGQNPNKEYTFIIHNVVDGQGGLEHTNSTVLSVNRWTYEGEKYKGFLKLVAHEYFHLWNVKRIRPIELGPFDYDNENYTTLLWVMEGFTSYYEKMILLRAGIYDQEQFLKSMFGSLNYVEGSVGTRVQPVAHASFDAWIKAYRPNENSSNTTMSYYSRGSVIAMMLDAMMIKKFNGEKCLDDFMQHIYAKYFVGKDRGFSDTEFKKELESFIGTSLDDFYADFIDGTEVPDYNSYFEAIGLKVKDVSETKPSAGMSLSSSGGKLIVRRIRSNSPAEEAGLSVNDEIIGCNGIRVDKKSFESFLSGMKVGDKMNILFAREDQMYSTDLEMTTYKKLRFAYEKVKDNDAAEKLFNYWLRSDEVVNR
jgi:predicted metalloprotease with PDZ domain